MGHIKRFAIIGLGALCLALGIIFILLPGPAIILMPLGLALLSVEFDWAKRWLKHCQRWMRKSAVKMDKLVARKR
ncbi:MAG: PGPGW domain-containing protein [Thalassotalea sp.]